MPRLKQMSVPAIANERQPRRARAIGRFSAAWVTLAVVVLLAAAPSTAFAATAHDDHYEVNEDQYFEARVTSNDDYSSAWPLWVCEIDLLTGPSHANVFNFNTALNSHSSGFGIVGYRGAQDWNGTDTFRYVIDDIGAASAAWVEIDVDPVNDPPSFTKGPNVTVAEDSGAYSAPWATALSPGPANEAGQALTFSVYSNSNPGLFAELPAVSPTGVLSFRPAANANGSANLGIRLTDDATKGGPALSVNQSLTIVVSNASESTEISLTCAPKPTLPYGSTYRLEGQLTSGGSGLGARQVTLERKAPGGVWASTGDTTMTAADGTYRFYVKTTTTAFYQVRFAGAGDYQPSTSPECCIAPCCSVGNPVAPSRMSRLRSYAVWGALKPRHTSGTTPVRIYRYRKVARSWVPYGYVGARVSNYSSYSKYRASVRLKYRGTWRLRAYAPADAGHAATWSKSYDYVTVR